MRKFVVGGWLAALVLSLGLAGAAAAPQEKPKSATPPSISTEKFAPLETWRAAVLAGNADALLAMYTTDPAPQLASPQSKAATVAEEVEFWSSLKKQGLSAIRVEVVRMEMLRPDVARVYFQVDTSTRRAGKSEKLYAATAQVWIRQGEVWRIGASQRQDFARLRQPIFPTDLFPANADPAADIKEALARAARQHKRVLLVFGGNWCYDCHVLEAAFHSPEIAPLLVPHFVVVHVDIGQMDKNLDVARKYDVPLEKGVPAIAVLESDGKLLFSQKNGEFEAARRMGPEDLVAFLNRWKPKANQ